MSINRRTFVIHSLLGTAVLASGQWTQAADAQKVQESDPQAVSLGYKDDATKVDKAKFPKYAAGEKCANCQLYTAKGADNGACAVFGGKLVMAGGWCSAYVKKAG